MIFQNRTEAGEKLGSKIQEFKGLKNLFVLAIPRGGVVVGKELADFLQCPLDIIVTKKISAPGNPELAIGAVGSAGEEVIDEELAARIGASKEYIKRQASSVKRLVRKKEKLLREGRKPLELKNKLVILTDDGVATGATMLAAIEVARQHDPKKIVVAVPVIARDSLLKIEKLADEVVYLDAPALFFAVGQFYQNFSQVTDQEVREILSN